MAIDEAVSQSEKDLKVAIDIPRPEYPRPQLRRDEWVNLNGRWEFEFDDDDRGLEEQWYLGSRKFDRDILVPFTFESKRSGINDRSSHERVWYQRDLHIPSDWAGRHILLHFGAVDYRTTAWVNGSVIGAHEGGHTPFTCDITRALKGSYGRLVVRAEDPPTDRYIPRGKQHWEEKPASIFYARTTGIWQTVWLEPVSRSHIVNVKITARVDGEVSVKFKISAPTGDQYVKVAVRNGSGVLASGMSMAIGPLAYVSLRLQDPTLWSPENPFLYDARLELCGPGGLQDAAETYFGCRSISTQDGKVLLNGNPYYLKTVLDQGYWPESNLTPPSDEAIQDDIRWQRPWVSTASASIRKWKIRDFYIGRTSWGCWSPPRWPTLTCSMTTQWRE